MDLWRYRKSADNLQIPVLRSVNKYDGYRELLKVVGIEGKQTGSTS